MKKIIVLFALGIVFWSASLQGTLSAQTTMAIPNGSFEQWTSHSGYSVSALFLSVPVYDTFSTPSVWNYPSYPVNETVSLMGFSVNINTNVPLIRSFRETGAVPAGSKAVKLQTFMLDDIVNQTVLSLAGDNIDTSITQRVIPSILTTGVVNIDAFIPLISNLMSGTGGLSAMLPTLLAVDVNDYITGGLALGDFRPGLLTGSYKYHSAVGGDNGAVMLLGTHYNTTTHQRDIVGGGLNLALTDTGVFVPFEVEYQPLSVLTPGAQNIAPDSLIVLLFSSASNDMQQGSYICLDNLMLWPAPETCADITYLAAVPQIHEAMVSWNVSDVADSFEIEYGPAGFVHGSGTQAVSSVATYTLSGLVANVAYDVYVRSLCSDTVYGEWSGTQFITFPDTCATVLELALVTEENDGVPHTVLTWSGSLEPEYWEIEYGPQGFQLGDGIRATRATPSFAIYQIEESGSLLPNTWYDFYVRSVCANYEGAHELWYGGWDVAHYRTHCATVSALTVNDDNTSVTADNQMAGYTVTWIDTTGTALWGVNYGIYSAENPDNWGTYVEVDTTYFELPPLAPDGQYTVEVTALCAEDNYGAGAMTTFTTPSLSGIEGADAMSLTVSPNPAQGQCEVCIADGKPVVLELYSLDGRLLQAVRAVGNNVVLSLPSQGIFLLRATTTAGTTTCKIVSQ